jgi:hypothetical protein
MFDVITINIFSIRAASTIMLHLKCTIVILLHLLFFDYWRFDSEFVDSFSDTKASNLRVCFVKKTAMGNLAAALHLLSENRPAGLVFIWKLQENKRYEEIGVITICVYKVRHTDLSF